MLTKCSIIFLLFPLFQAGHDFPIVFYLAVGGSLLSYIYSAPPLKVLHFFCYTIRFSSLIYFEDLTCFLIKTRDILKSVINFSSSRMDGLETSLWVQVTLACLGMISAICSIHVEQIVFVATILTYINKFATINIFCRWAGQALFGTLTPEIVALTTFYSIAGVFIFFSISYSPFPLITHTCYDNKLFSLLCS
jgi:hypothetical protein